MTGDPTSATDAPPAESPIDPEALSERPGVDAREHTFVHESPDHCEADAKGRVIVGVVDTDGELLVREPEDGPYPVLPNGVVEHGEDWTEVAREVGETAAGVEVELVAPVRVRHVEHRLEGEDGSEETAHVVFRAEPASDREDGAPSAAGAAAWTSRWRAELPTDLEEETAPVVEDVRLFLD